MTTPAPSAPWWAPYVPAIALLIVIVGAILTGGGYLRTQEEHTRRISQLEADARTDAKSRTEMLQQLDLRLARIEVKLEMMTPSKGKAP